MKVAGIESSCDETAVAIVEGRKILSSVVASQNDIHSKYGGVVPELASRRHVEIIIPLFDAAVKQAGITLSGLDGIAVTRAPGLVGALLVGLSAAKAIAFAMDKPLIGVNHLEGHLNAIHLAEENVPYPHIGLIVSGGHTSLYYVSGFGRYKLLGATRDDAAGEAFDKVARLLKLGYPGGPVIDSLAGLGNPDIIKFRQAKFTNLSEFDFSFSGIKTAAALKYRELSQNGKIRKADLHNLIAGFQKTVVEALAGNMIKAARKFRCRDAVVSGGVAANSGLRKRMLEAKAEEGLSVHIPPASLCTDNAAMIAFVGGERLKRGERSAYSLNATAVEEIGI